MGVAGLMASGMVTTQGMNPFGVKWMIRSQALRHLAMGEVHRLDGGGSMQGMGLRYSRSYPERGPLG